MRTYIYISIVCGLALAAPGCVGRTCEPYSQQTGRQYILSADEMTCYPVAAPSLTPSLTFGTPPLRGPSIGMPPMYAPGMTTTPFLNADGSTTFCNTTNYGEGGPLTICQ